jgi:hypothetical protein
LDVPSARERHRPIQGASDSPPPRRTRPCRRRDQRLGIAVREKEKNVVV